MSIIDEELTERDDYMYVGYMGYTLMYIVAILLLAIGGYLIYLTYEISLNRWFGFTVGLLSMLIGLMLVHSYQWLKVKPKVTEWKE
jgi:hypothetical protein